MFVGLMQGKKARSTAVACNRRPKAESAPTLVRFPKVLRAGGGSEHRQKKNGCVSVMRWSWCLQVATVGD